MEFFTLGVYNSAEEEYFGKIISANIDVFCDIRQRRGVRGAKYAFVNSKRLQDRLAKLNVEYLHEIQLAPTSEIRDLQKEADLQQKELKRDRSKLGSVFTLAFKDRILNEFNFEAFIHNLEKINAKRIILFCVEEKPEACHRGIVTNKLEKLGYKITHL
ncbi:MAG: DUF488 family protein [Crocinitomix sp.]|nr:DUF488 family protein [Crocinitomix sp.]